MSTPVSPPGCGCPPACPNPVVVNMPGSTGPPGLNAFGVTVGAFTVPAVSATVAITVSPNQWYFQGQIVQISSAGFFEVADVFNQLFTNLGYPENASPGTVIGTGAQVSPSGPQGAAGALNNVSPTTTKGDLLVDSGGNHPSADVVRFPVGTNGNVLTAKSGVSAGVEWDAVDLTGAATTLSGSLPLGNGGTGGTDQPSAIRSIFPPNPTIGALVAFLAGMSGNVWKELDTNQGSVGQVLSTTGASPNTVPVWAWPALIQHQKLTYNTYTSATTGIVLSGTTAAPTTFTGTQIFSLTVTPKSATSRLVVRASVCLLTSASGAYVAIFNGTTLLAAALCAPVSQAQQVLANYEFAPGATTPITFNVYVGTGNSGTTYINGNATAVFFGGKVQSLLTVEEYA